MNQINRRVLLAVGLTVCLYSSHAHGGIDPYVLTDPERAQWSQFAQQEQQFTQQFDQAILAAVGTPVGDKSRDIHGEIQRAWLSLNLVQTRRDAFLAKLQAEHGCKSCTIQDGKLAPPPKN